MAQTKAEPEDCATCSTNDVNLSTYPLSTSGITNLTHTAQSTLDPQACIPQLKKWIQSRPDFKSKMGTEFSDHLAIYNDILHTGKILEHYLTKEFKEGDPPDSLQNEIKLTQKGDETTTLSSSYELKASYDSINDRVEYLLETEATLVKNGMPTEVFKTDSKIHGDCSLTEISESLTSYLYQGEQARLKRTTLTSDGDKNTQERVVPKRLIEGSQKLIDIGSFFQAKENELDVFLDFDEPLVHLHIDRFPSFERLNALTGKMGRFDRLSLDFYQDKKIFLTMEVEASADGAFSRTKVVAPEFLSSAAYNEVISQDEWNQISKLFTKNPKKLSSTGFTEKDFSQFELIYEVQASKKLEFDNLGAYGTLNLVTTNANHTNYVFVDGRKDPTRIAHPRSKELSQNLKSTQYYDFKSQEVQEVIQAVRSHEPKTQEDAVKVILTELSERLKYDDGMMNEHTVRMMSASEALKRKSGVCQHYSAAFVAVARGLGIPAKMIFGIALSGDSRPFRHAWVEVSLDRKTWSPLDPQIKDLIGLPSRGYIPLGVFHAYEQNADSLQISLADDFAVSNELEFKKK